MQAKGPDDVRPSHRQNYHSAHNFELWVHLNDVVLAASFLNLACTLSLKLSNLFLCSPLKDCANFGKTVLLRDYDSTRFADTDFRKRMCAFGDAIIHCHPYDDSEYGCAHHNDRERAVLAIPQHLSVIRLGANDSLSKAIKVMAYDHRKAGDKAKDSDNNGLCRRRKHDHRAREILCSSLIVALVLPCESLSATVTLALWRLNQVLGFCVANGALLDVY